MPVNTSTSIIDTKMPRGQSRAAIIAIGVSTATLLILSSALIITVVVLIWRHKRRSTKHHLYTDSSHSLLSRRSGQQVQPQENLSELYNQIYLSPSAGQTEYIPKCETASIINNLSITSQNIDPTYSMTGDDIAGHSSILNAANRVTTSQLSSHKAQESTSEQPTYAAVDKTKKKFKRQRKKEDPQCKAAEKGSPITPYGHEATSPHTIEDLYTAIKKKPNVCELKGKEETPQIPPRTVEELYTTVQKKSKHTFHGDGNKDEVPSHKVDQMHAARGKPSPILQNITGDLYTEVMKKPKDGSADDTEAAPPIPPHTVEELYTADI